MADLIPERLLAGWDRLRGHVLFIPGLLTVAGIFLSIATIELDRTIDAETLRGLPFIFRGGAGGAREVLSTVAGAMVQLAAITFSITILTLTLRSQQFGPQLLRNFTKDQLNQGVLGAFIGTFAYSLLVLRAVRDLDDADAVDLATFTPLLSVTFSIALAILSLGLFVVFIDRIVSAIQANSIIDGVARETSTTIRSLFPEPLGEGRTPEAEPPPGAHPSTKELVTIPAPRSGFIQNLRSDDLMELACEEDILMWMEVRPGGFVIEGDPIARVSPAGRVSDQLIDSIQAHYTIARHRSTANDPEFGIRQLVDIALKALSPSDNDPTTASSAIEYLGVILVDFATRAIPTPIRRDDEGSIRVIALGPTFRSMVDLAFNQVREHGEGDVAITLQLLHTLSRVAGVVEAEARRDVLQEHLGKLSRSADRSIADPADRAEVNELLRRATESLARTDRVSDYLLPLVT